MTIREELNSWLEAYDLDPADLAESSAAGRHSHGVYDNRGCLGHVFCRACHDQPARRFEEFTGIKNVAGHYTMPEGLEPYEVENYEHLLYILTRAGKMSREEMLLKKQALWEVLKTLNPGLDVVKPNERDPGAAIMGVTSGFNAVDIHDFIHVGGGSQRSPAYNERVGRLESALGGFDIEWVPAEQTLAYMEREVALRKAQPQKDRLPKPSP